MTIKKDISDLIVNTDTLANLLGFTRQRINQLAKEGILEKQAAGRFPLVRNVQRYIEFLKTGNRGVESEEFLAMYEEEKAFHEKAKREMAELKLAKQKNQLHDAADVELVLTNMLVTFRTRMLSIPEKVAPKILGINNLAEISGVLTDELLKTLKELSEYDPNMFVREEGVNAEEDPEDGEAIQENPEIPGSSSKADNQ